MQSQYSQRNIESQISKSRDTCEIALRRKVQIRSHPFGIYIYIFLTESIAAGAPIPCVFYSSVSKKKINND